VKSSPSIIVITLISYRKAMEILAQESV